MITLYLIGKGITNICLKKSTYFSNNIFLNILFNIFISFLLISSLSAIISTKGQTFQWVIFCSIVGWFIYANKKINQEIVSENNIIPVNNLSKILILSILSVFSFSFIYYINGVPKNSMDVDVYYDLFYYSKISSKLLEVGVENPLVLLSSYLDINGTYLYHYTDLWFNGFICKITSLSETETLLFVTYPILLFLTLLGTFSVLYEKLNINAAKIILITIILLYGCSVYLPFENSAIYKQAYSRFQGGPGLDWMLTKTLISFPSLFLAFYSLKRERLTEFTIWILIAMASYNTAIPVLTGGTFMILIYTLYKVFFKKQNYFKREIFISVVITGVFFLFLVLYTKFFILKEVPPTTIEILSIRSMIILFIESMISPWMVYLFAAIIVLIEVLKRRVNEFQILLILFLLGGQLAGAAFVILNHHINNVTQALSNPIPPLILVFTIFFLKTIPKNKYLYLSCIILLTFSSFHNIYLNKNVIMNDAKHRNLNYSDIFKKAISTEINLNHKKAKWVTLNKSYNSTYFYYCHAPGSFIFNIKNADYPLDISPYLTDSASDFCNIYWNSSFPLCKEIIKKPDSSEQIILDFLMKKKVSYVFIENQTAIPSILSKRIKLVVKDRYTGDAFYKLIF